LKNAIAADWAAPTKVVAFSTLRDGGVSKAPYESLNFAYHVGDSATNVHKNRTTLSAHLSPKLQWQWLQQIHGAGVVEVVEPTVELAADALFTKQPNVVCCVQTADCLPVFFAARNGSEVAIAHAGWKGLVAGVLENTVRKMSSDASEIIAWLGPAIGPCHFEVGAEVKESFLESANSLAVKESLEGCFKITRSSQKFMADIYAIARIKLSQLGISQITGGSHCTYCAEECFFSYRRDGVSGRMLNAIYIDA
jgi:YfiH family protein